MRFRFVRESGRRASVQSKAAARCLCEAAEEVTGARVRQRGGWRRRTCHRPGQGVSGGHCSPRTAVQPLLADGEEPHSCQRHDDTGASIKNRVGVTSLEFGLPYKDILNLSSNKYNENRYKINEAICTYEKNSQRQSTRISSHELSLSRLDINSIHGGRKIDQAFSALTRRGPQLPTGAAVLDDS